MIIHYLSSDNELSFKINKKLNIKDLSIKSKLNFDELFTNSKYQDLIYLKNGNILINYIKEELKIDLNKRPADLSSNDFFRITEKYEKKIN